jgi:hypothetical protein
MGNRFYISAALIVTVLKLEVRGQIAEVKSRDS